jgi:hypothetical protein
MIEKLAFLTIIAFFMAIFISGLIVEHRRNVSIKRASANVAGDPPEQTNRRVPSAAETAQTMPGAASGLPANPEE